MIFLRIILFFIEKFSTMFFLFIFVIYIIYLLLLQVMQTLVVIILLMKVTSGVIIKVKLRSEGWEQAGFNVSTNV